MSNSEIKKYSKEFIKAKRTQAFSIILFGLFFCLLTTALIFTAVFFTEILISGLENTVAKTAIKIFICLFLIFFSVIILCVYSSVSIGEKAWYNGLTSEKKNYKKRLYFWFKPKCSLRAFGFKIILLAIKLFCSVAFLLPCALTIWSVYYLTQTGGLEMYLFLSLVAGAVLLGISGLIFRFIVIQRYFLADYIFSTNPKITALTAIRQSKNLLDGHIYEIVRFKLSFIPWFISCLLIFPSFYFIPYYKASCSLVAKKITM